MTLYNLPALVILKTFIHLIPFHTTSHFHHWWYLKLSYISSHSAPISSWNDIIYPIRTIRNDSSILNSSVYLFHLVNQITSSGPLVKSVFLVDVVSWILSSLRSYKFLFSFSSLVPPLTILYSSVPIVLLLTHFVPLIFISLRNVPTTTGRKTSDRGREVWTV